MAIANITEGNIGGYGYMGRITGQLGQRRSLGIVTFRNPYLNDSLTSLQIDGYRTTTNFSSFFETRTGGAITLGRWLAEYSTGAISFFAEEINYRDPAAGVCPNLVPRICQQLGTQSTTGIRANFFKDTRDYYMDPRTGWRVGGGVDIGTEYFGGSNNFIKYSADVINVTPLLFDTRLSLRGRFGAVEPFGDRPPPLSEVFYVGGINTLRGFQFGRAGPVVPTTRFPIGATKQLIFNADFVFTISSEAKLNGVIFFDYGKGFDDGESLSIVDLRKAAGIEGRWISPFGPLRAAYGVNLDPKPGERFGVFEFTVGSLF
jgi:outer membrane protein insertion porin family